MEFWDMVAHRYPCPDFLLDGYLSSGRLHEFILKCWELNQEDVLWEFWLHKVNDGKSFNDFRKKLNGDPDAPGEKPSDEDIRAIIESSRTMLDEMEFVEENRR